MKIESPRIIVAGLRGGSGKTLVSVGVSAALRRRGILVQPFKKGPDFIDASWLSRAAGRACYNLDTFMTGEDRVIRSFAQRVVGAEAAIIEGNRGVFDGMDSGGSHCTARLAEMIQSPVALVVDATKSTRTLAASILGCKVFPGGDVIKCVILNRVAGIRHQDVTTSSIEKYCDVQVVGALPKLKYMPFPERHMGLIPPQEHDLSQESIEKMADLMEKCIDLDRFMSIMRAAQSIEMDMEYPENIHLSNAPRVGIIRDSAFQFYYPENIEELERNGAVIVETSPLTDSRLPDIDALYIGGGFPETHAEQISANESYRNSVKEAAEAGMPIYGECGGAMFLGSKLVVAGVEYPMTGVFPATFGMEETPQRHGYTVLEARKFNPFFKTGSVFRGHEFHYSRILDWEEGKIETAFSVKRGYGFDGKRDGMCYNNVIAVYTHVHSLGAEDWASSFVKAAGEYSGKQSSDTLSVKTGGRG